MSARAYWLQALHLALALSIPLALTLLMGCLKAKAKPEDLGPEVPSSTITEILNKETATAELSNLKVGQYVDFINTRRIEVSDIDMTLGSHRVEVIDAQDSATETDYTFKITDNVRNSSDGFLTVVSQDSLHLKKAVSSSLARLMDANAGDTGARTTFHHLQESDSYIDAPDAVKARAGCGGLANCQIPVHNVHFDLVNWTDSTNYNKTTLDLSFSTVTPYIPYGSGMQQLTGVLVSDCRATYVSAEGSEIYVRDCMTLDDFQN